MLDMATCKQSAHEFLQNTFSPNIAVLCSSDAETICAKNNLTFVQMVQPFCRLNTEIVIRDPSNAPTSLHNFRISVKDAHSQVPSLNAGKKIMYDAVANNVLTATDGALFNSIKSDSFQLKYNVSTPWFESYRENFFQVISPSEHEFMQRYLSCVFVVSSSHQDPLAQIDNLCQQQLQLQNTHNYQWFFSEIFKYYLLLHDTSSESLGKAEAIYQSMKNSFGSTSCHLLQINSSPSSTEHVNASDELNGNSNMPDPWSQFLQKSYNSQVEMVKDTDSSEEPTDVECLPNDAGTHADVDVNTVVNHPLLSSYKNQSTTIDSSESVTNPDNGKTLIFGPSWKNGMPNKKHGTCLTLSDIERIKVFVHDFCVQGLVPSVERQLRVLNEQVINRKSIHRTLFGMTKKIFTGSKPNMQKPAVSTNSVIYGQEATELQLRKLGDLAFMFQLYEVAYQAYHAAKRDFNADEAWLHFAGACEMAALSIFMQGNAVLHEYPARYMETAIATYLHTCKLPENSIRATFMSTECLKAKTLFKDAAEQFMRLPSDADLPCALFLEQAAYCYINCDPPKLRKFSFHMILSGHRYSKAGQRKHALRAYKQGLQAYNHIQWLFAKNHINSMIGRFSLHLNQIESAYLAFKQLLISQNELPAQDQANNLREYLLSLMQFLNHSDKNVQRVSLPVPFLAAESTKVLLGENLKYHKDGSLFISGRSFLHGDTNNDLWFKLEELVILSCYQNLPAQFIPQQYCFTELTNNIHQPLAVVNETVTVEVFLTNPLNIVLCIDNVFLLWTFSKQSDSNSGKEPVTFSNELDFSKAMVLSSVVETEVLQKISFEPRQQKNIHLTLRPLHTGTLVIKGLAYCLLSSGSEKDSTSSPDKTTSVISIQGKQSLELQGPRLNKTATDRIAKVYAIDNRLNIQVLSSMPKLQVKYHSFPNTLYSGEIHQTKVEFTNIGKKPLYRIIIASPTPGLFAVGNTITNRNLSEIYQERLCGKTDCAPLWENIELFNWKEELKMLDRKDCCIQPGESLTVTLWLRGSDVAGQCNTKLLYYYEIQDKNSRLNHRLIQHSIVLDIKPSLIVHANYYRCPVVEYLQATSNSHSKCDSLVLSLEASNNSEEMCDINLIQVSCISPKWYISSFQGYDYLKTSSPFVQKGETFLLNFKAESLTKTGNNSTTQDMSCAFSCSPLGCFKIDSTVTPYCDFSCKSIYSWADLVADEGKQSKKTNQLLDSQLVLTTVWKAKAQRDGLSTVIIGQHHSEIKYSGLTTGHIPLQTEENVQSQEAIPSSISVPGQLVICTLAYPTRVLHNFNKKRLLTVPVKFLAQSTSNSTLQIMIDNANYLPRMSYGFDEQLSGSMSQSFTWVKSSKRETELKPRESINFQMCAAFSSPGSFNLGCLNVKVKTVSDAGACYIMSPYVIVIKDSDFQ